MWENDTKTYKSFDIFNLAINNLKNYGKFWFSP